MKMDYRQWIKGTIVAMIAWAGYRLYIVRPDERRRIRAQERERIARDLHDTLLQSVQGLLLTVQAISRKPSSEGTREELTRAVEMARQAVIESRDKLGMMRGDETGRGCPLRLFINEIIESIFPDDPPVRVMVEGRVRQLHWDIGGEVVSIAREALVNASRHADASAIRVRVVFSWRRLIVIVTDDGKGIPQGVLAEGMRRDHYGLLGMRERAEAIPADLRIRSHAASGTEVRLTVPAHLAYI
ncbi:sensor histidine kinase [Luteibacter sp.]|jgi:signal transduction histidine kinase|uniref:sensor histidine kinase n=1 Tax=Luteibacter sp. TaxID=1886636 RepID=UPI002F40B3F7